MKYPMANTFQTTFLTIALLCFAVTALDPVATYYTKISEGHEERTVR